MGLIVSGLINDDCCVSVPNSFELKPRSVLKNISDVECLLSMGDDIVIGELISSEVVSTI